MLLFKDYFVFKNALIDNLFKKLHIKGLENVYEDYLKIDFLKMASSVRDLLHRVIRTDRSGKSLWLISAFIDVLSLGPYVVYNFEFSIESQWNFTRASLEYSKNITYLFKSFTILLLIFFFFFFFFFFFLI